MPPIRRAAERKTPSKHGMDGPGSNFVWEKEVVHKVRPAKIAYGSDPRPLVHMWHTRLSPCGRPTLSIRHCSGLAGAIKMRCSLISSSQQAARDKDKINREFMQTTSPWEADLRRPNSAN